MLLHHFRFTVKGNNNKALRKNNYVVYKKLNHAAFDNIQQIKRAK